MRKINTMGRGWFIVRLAIEKGILSKQQIDFELNNKSVYIDKKRIKDFLSTLSYPLYFLDFETYQMSIPEYDYVKPYEQIPFQYSLHYYKNSKSKLMHKEFLSEIGIDPRRKIAESLVKDIPKDVCIDMNPVSWTR